MDVRECDISDLERGEDANWKSVFSNDPTVHARAALDSYDVADKHVRSVIAKFASGSRKYTERGGETVKQPPGVIDIDVSHVELQKPKTACRNEVSHVVDNPNDFLKRDVNGIVEFFKISDIYEHDFGEIDYGRAIRFLEKKKKLDIELKKQPEKGGELLKQFEYAVEAYADTVVYRYMKVAKMANVSLVITPHPHRKDKFKATVDKFELLDISQKKELLRELVAIKQSVASDVDLPKNTIVRKQRLRLGQLPWPVGVDSVNEEDDIIRKDRQIVEADVPDTNSLLGHFLPGGDRSVFIPFIMHQARNRMFVNYEKTSDSYKATIQSVMRNNFREFRKFEIIMKCSKSNIYSTIVEIGTRVGDLTASLHVQLSTVLLAYGVVKTRDDAEQQLRTILDYALLEKIRCENNVKDFDKKVKQVKLAISSIWKYERGVVDKDSARKFIEGELIRQKTRDRGARNKQSKEIHKEDLDALMMAAKEHELLLQDGHIFEEDMENDVYNDEDDDDEDDDDEDKQESAQPKRQIKSHEFDTILPHLTDDNDSVEKTRFIIAAIQRLILVHCGLEEPDDAGDLKNQYMRSPGETLLQIAQESASGMGAAMMKSAWSLLTKKNTDDMLCVILGLPSRAFTEVGVRFLQENRLGKKSKAEVSLQTPVDLSNLGKMTLTTQVTMKPDILKLNTAGDILDKKSLHPSYVGYIDPTQINATGDTDSGGRVLHLSLACRVSPSIETTDVSKVEISLKHTVSATSRSNRISGPKAEASYNIMDSGAVKVYVCINGKLSFTVHTLRYDELLSAIRSLIDDKARADQSDGVSICKRTRASLYTQDKDLVFMWNPGRLDNIKVIHVDISPGRYLRPLLSLNSETCDKLNHSHATRMNDMVAKLTVRSPRELVELPTPLQSVWTLDKNAERVVYTNALRASASTRMMELSPFCSVGVLASKEASLTRVKGNKVVLGMTQLNRELDPVTLCKPLVLTTAAYYERPQTHSYLSMRGITTGEVAMMAVMPIGPETDSGNEEDAITVSRGAAERGLLKLIHKYTVRVSLNRQDLEPLCSAHFAHPIDYKMKDLASRYTSRLMPEGNVEFLAPGLPGINAYESGHYIIGFETQKDEVVPKAESEGIEDNVRDTSFTFDDLVQVSGYQSTSSHLRISVLEVHVIYSVQDGAPTTPSQVWQLSEGELPPVPVYELPKPLFYVQQYHRGKDRSMQLITTPGWQGPAKGQMPHSIRLIYNIYNIDEVNRPESESTTLTSTIVLKPGQTLGVPRTKSISERHRILRNKSYDPMHDPMHALDKTSGAPTEGSRIKNGDYVVGKVIKDAQSNILDKSELLHTRQGGDAIWWTVSKVVRTLHTMSVELVSEGQPLKNGDKICTRAGQKGAIIIADSAEIPYMCTQEDGVEKNIIPDVVLHPCAITSRVTPSILLEQLLGSVCAREGYHAVSDTCATNFDMIPAETQFRPSVEGGRQRSTLSIEDLYTKRAKVHTQIVRSGITGEILSENGFCAPVQVRRLRQSGMFTAKDNVKVSTGGNMDRYTLQPKRGREDGSLRLGTDEMDHICCIGSSHLLRDLRSIDERPVLMCQTCQQIIGNYTNGQLCPICKEKMTVHTVPNPILTLTHTLAALNINMHQHSRYNMHEIEETAETAPPAEDQTEQKEDNMQLLVNTFEFLGFKFHGDVQILNALAPDTVKMLWTGLLNGAKPDVIVAKLQQIGYDMAQIVMVEERKPQLTKHIIRAQIDILLKISKVIQHVAYQRLIKTGEFGLDIEKVQEKMGYNDSDMFAKIQVAAGQWIPLHELVQNLAKGLVKSVFKRFADHFRKQLDTMLGKWQLKQYATLTTDALIAAVGYTVPPQLKQSLEEYASTQIFMMKSHPNRLKHVAKALWVKHANAHAAAIVTKVQDFMKFTTEDLRRPVQNSTGDRVPLLLAIQNTVDETRLLAKANLDYLKSVATHAWKGAKNADVDTIVAKVRALLNFTEEDLMSLIQTGKGDQLPLLQVIKAVVKKTKPK